MKCKDREGNLVPSDEGQEKLLNKLYGTAAGRRLLQIAVRPEVSEMAGRFLDTHVSARLITPFLERSDISMEEYEEEDYESYNQFFTRRIKEGRRTFSEDPADLCAPCDSRVSVYPVEPEGVFTVKNTVYSMQSLFHSRRLEERYRGGTICIFRLTVSDYHHYCYVDRGIKTKNYRIPGQFHTVTPVEKGQRPVYSENTREFSLLRSENFGNILMMEVGALLVGKIVNHHEAMEVRRGMEKGYFEFGGSTVILVFEEDTVDIDADLLANTGEGVETLVKQGEKIGRKKSAV